MFRRLSFTASELDEIRALIEQRSGIHFDSSRERFFSMRITEYVADRKLETSADLMRLLLSSNVEYQLLLQSLLTHETSFFRYPDAFEAMKRRVLPEIQSKRLWSNPRTVRIWSAGCSTGEEPYSMAIAIAESVASFQTWDVQILATDISRPAVDQAIRGIYNRRRLGNLSLDQIGANFTTTKDNLFEVKPNLRKMVSFVTMNLAQSLYVGRMDCIFCMNVLIYFSEEARHQVIRNFYNCLEPGGYLFLGHSETVGKLQVELERIVLGDCLLYRKPTGDKTAPNSGNPS